MKSFSFPGMAALALLIPVASKAAITYVDAAPANTPGLSPLASGWSPRGAGLGADTSNFANEGGVYEAAAGSSEASVTNLVTTINVPNGTYDVYAFFWSDRTGQTNDWDLTAGILGGTLQQFTTDTPGVIAINSSTQAVPATTVSGLNVLGQGADDYSDFVDGNRTLYAAPLGTEIVTTGQIQIDIDSSDLRTGRTWYDGVGYAAVIPEPTSTLLAGLGLVGLIRRRR